MRGQDTCPDIQQSARDTPLHDCTHVPDQVTEKTRPFLSSRPNNSTSPKGAEIRGHICRGLGISLDMRIVEAPGATGDYNTDLGSKARAAVSAFETGEYDLGFLHVKAVDDAGVQQASLTSVFPCNPSSFALLVYFSTVDDAGIVPLAPANTRTCTSILLFLSRCLWLPLVWRRRKQ